MEKSSANRILIGYQKIFWLLCLIYFAVTVVVVAAGSEVGFSLSFWGVYAVLVLSMGKLIIFAEQFRATGRSGFMLLSYLLMLVIIAAFLVGSRFL